MTAGSQAKQIWCPWDFVHFRRLVTRACDPVMESGTSMIEHMFPLYRRIKLSVDQMVMYRLHIMPTRWACWVDTGSQTVAEQMDTLNQYRTFLRASVAMDATQLDARFNPPAMDSILFFSRPDGDESKMETLPGTNDVPDVPDLETLFKLLFGSARTPKTYLGFGDDDQGLAKASLVAQDIRFARLIRVLRKPFMQGIHRLAELQLAFTGKDPRQYRIRVQMSKISALEEEVRAATMEKQSALATAIIDICQRLSIPNKEIVELVFREFLQLPRDFVDVAKLAMSVQQAVGQPQDGAGAGGGGIGMPPGAGGDIGAGLGFPPPPGEPGQGPVTPPSEEDEKLEPNQDMFQPPAEGAGKKRNNLLVANGLAFRRSIVEGFQNSIKGQAANIPREMAAVSHVVSDLMRIHTSGKSSLVEADSSRNLSLGDLEPLPVVVDSTRKIRRPDAPVGVLLENQHRNGKGAFEFSGAVAKSDAAPKSGEAVHEAVELVERVRAKKAAGKPAKPAPSKQKAKHRQVL